MPGGRFSIFSPLERKLKRKLVNRRWNKAHPETVRASREKHSRNNPGYSTELSRQWRTKHREEALRQGRVANYLRRARLRGGEIGNLDEIAAWEASWRTNDSVECEWCGKTFPAKFGHADHITAIASGGPHALHNLCIACPTCNKRKAAKHVHRWLRELLGREIIICVHDRNIFGFLPKNRSTLHSQSSPSLGRISAQTRPSNLIFVE